MGPAAWLAVGRALGLAIASNSVFGRNGAVRVVAEQVALSIERHEFEMAKAMIRSLRREHRAAFDDFMAKFGSELPPEFKTEL